MDRKVKNKLVILLSVLILCLIIRNYSKDHKYIIKKDKYIYYINDLDTLNGIVSFKNSNNTIIKIDTLKK